LKYLDLFDVNISNDGMQHLQTAIEPNKTLRSIRLANTHVSFNMVGYFQKFIKAQYNIKCFRWINVVGIADQTRQR